jgi:S1-C subfamily serine protease
MRTRLLAALLALAATPAAAEGFRIGDWEGRAVAAAPAPAGPACVATSRQAQGRVLSLRLERSGALAVLVTYQRWTAPVGRDLGAIFAFDDRARQSTTARVVSTGTLRLAIADSAAFASALRAAQELQIYSSGAAASFRLDDVGAVLDRLASCAGIEAPPVATAPPAEAAENAESPPTPNRFLESDPEQGATRFLTTPVAGGATPRWPTVQREFAPMRVGEAQGLGLTPPDIERVARQTVHLLWVDATDKETWTSIGSAVAVSRDTLLTNCHVVRAARRIWMRQGVRSAPATLLAANDETDRCLIRVEGFPLTPVNGVRPIASLRAGEPVYSLGNPGGHERVFGAGVISAVRQRRGVSVIQTTAPMSPGSSGGGLFDAHGNLIGITSFRLIGAGRQSGGYAIAAEEFWR